MASRNSTFSSAAKRPERSRRKSSDLASGVTGEIHYVDGGYNIVGW
jgi:hypothetical protein